MNNLRSKLSNLKNACHIQNVSVEDVGSFENLEDAYAAGPPPSPLQRKQGRSEILLTGPYLFLRICWLAALRISFFRRRNGPPF